jgi:hypothetical protein
MSKMGNVFTKPTVNEWIKPEVTARCGGVVVLEPVSVKSRWTGELEEGRKRVNRSIAELLTIGVLGAGYSFRFADAVLAAGKAVSASDKLREGFMQLIDVFTAISEPILWFYALIGCIMMATGKNKEKGMEKLKQVGYAYVVIALLPTIFDFLRYISTIIKASVQVTGFVGGWF